MNWPFDLNLHAAMPGLIADADGFLIDWDGCCAVDNKLLPSAARFLRANQARTVIVSNNSSNTVEDFRQILSRAGIDMRPEQIILAGVEAISRAAEIGSVQSLVLSAPRMKYLARRLGVRVSSESPELIVLMRDTHFAYSHLEIVVNALAKGAYLIVSNPDGTHPGKGGRLRPETGALLAAIRACIDVPAAQLEIIGKPYAPMFLKGCHVLDKPPASIMMIGDNSATDIAGAKALGMPGLLVTPGPEQFFRTLVETLKIA